MTIARKQRQRSTFISSAINYITKRRQKSPFLFFFFLFLIGYFSLYRPLHDYSNATSTHLKRQRFEYRGDRLFSSPEDLPIELIHSLDAILVLGGGRPKSIDHPPVFVERRCDDAIEVVRRRVQGKSTKDLKGLKGSEQRQKYQYDDQQQGLPILCLSAGTAHLPQLLSADGLPIWESTACAAYILSKSKNGKNATTPNMILPESIFVETSSYDTIGNAYFARTSHTEFNGWRRLLIVTNEFHMERTVKIFDWIFSAPTDEDAARRTAGLNQFLPYSLYYLESPNVGMASEVVAARKEREASSSKSVDKLSKKYSTLRKVYEFLTHEHSLYAANGLVGRGRASAADVEEGSVKDVVKRSYGAN